MTTPMLTRQAVRAAPRALRAAVCGASPRTILAIGFGVFLLYAFPGYMSSDSVVQLIEARTRIFTNAHPPVMAAEWCVLELLVSGPLLMLLVQGTLFLGGLHALLRHRLAPRCAAAAAVALLLFPPILGTMAVIWKDSQMAAYLVAGTAAMLGGRLRHRLVGLALLSAACAFRYNAAAAVLPLVVLLFVWRPGQPWWKRYPIAAVAFVAAVAVAFQVNRMLTVETRFLSPAYTDIVGVLYYEAPRSDEELRHVLRGTPLHVHDRIHETARGLYSPRNSWQVNRGDGRLFDDPTTPEHAAALSRAWKEMVLADPRAYLHHRLAVYEELLGLSDSPLWSPHYNGFVESPDQMTWINHVAYPSRFQQKAGEVLDVLSTDTPMFRVYMYAALALALLVLCCRDRLTFALLASGILYELGYFPTVSTPDFRYSHWLITSTCTAALLLFVQRYRAGRAADHGVPPAKDPGSHAG